MVVGHGILFVLRSFLMQILRLYSQPSPTEFAVLHYFVELLVHGCLGTQIPSGVCRLGLAVAMTNLRLRNFHMPTLRGCCLLSFFSAFAVSGNLCLGTLALIQPSFGPSLRSSSTAQHVRCEQCWPHEDNAPNSLACENLQRRLGCHACDIVGCWRTNRACTFYNRGRENHRDGGLGDNVAHMSQTRIEILKDDETLETGRILAPMWWINHRIVIRIEGVDYFMGAASGDGCNCLIDTLRQCLDLVCNVSYVREVLEHRHRGKNSQIGHMAYLQLDWHWRDVLQLLAQHNLCDRSFDVNDCRVVCVDMNMPGHGDVFGRVAARRILYICRQNLNHFVPLFRLRGSGGPMACRHSKSQPSHSPSSALPGLASSAFSSHAQSSSARVVPSAAQATPTSIDESTGSSRCAILIVGVTEAAICS